MRKSFQVSSRASRTEFWWFAPVGLAIPVAVGFLTPPHITGLGTLAAKLALVTLATIPLTSAASRRFHDTCIPDAEFWRGIGPSVGLVASGFCLIFGLFAIFTLWGAPLGVVISLVSVVMFLGCLFIAPETFGTTLGQLIVPSQPNSNSYGPNPFEAPK